MSEPRQWGDVGIVGYRGPYRCHRCGRASCDRETCEPSRREALGRVQACSRVFPMCMGRAALGDTNCTCGANKREWADVRAVRERMENGGDHG